MRSLRLSATLCVVLPATILAQGTISTLGFGYPTGQFSTRALGTGGAVGEIDPQSATNPAVIGNYGISSLYFQADPEFRTLHLSGLTEQTSIARYPLIVAAFPVTPTIMLGLSASNFLDRSFSTSARGAQTIGDSTFATTNSFSSDGAISDLRIALAWAPERWLHVGAAAHAITGDNRVRNTQIFDDSAQFSRLVDTATVGYSGNAYSVGFEALPFNGLSLAGSYRKGGPLSVKRGDTTLANAHVPDRLSMSAAFIGIHNMTLAVRTSKDDWSQMQSLGSSAVHITDSWDTSVGADLPGPRLGDYQLQVRGGARWRTLPFGTATSSVSENSYSIGLGTTLSRGHTSVDFAAIHADRTAGSSLSESAWTLSFGLTVRP